MQQKRSSDGSCAVGKGAIDVAAESLELVVESQDGGKTFFKVNKTTPVRRVGWHEPVVVPTESISCALVCCNIVTKSKLSNADGKFVMTVASLTLQVHRMYCDRMQVDERGLAFVFNGDRLPVWSQQTLQGAGVVDGDEISAFVKQSAD